jgi:hypothetical protein
MAFSTANPSPSAARAISRAKAAAGLRTSRNLSATARLVGLEFLARADKRTGMCTGISIASLAEAVGACERHVRRCIAALAQRGFLLVVKKGGHQPDDYHLLVGKLAAMADNIAHQVQTVCTAAARAARAARAHVKARTGNILAAAREARRAAHAAAQEERDKLKATSPAPVPAPLKTGPRPIPDRTFCPRIPSMEINLHKMGKGLLNIASQAGFWKSPAAPQGQVLTDQQLDNKAYARISEALARLGQTALAQFYDHPDAAQLQAEAIKAERFNPDHGRTGLAVITARIMGVTA